MERADLLKQNGAIFTGIGKSLNKFARPSVKVTVVGNPANTNCLIAANNAPDIPMENFSAMTRLDHDRGKKSHTKTKDGIYQLKRYILSKCIHCLNSPKLVM